MNTRWHRQIAAAIFFAALQFPGRAQTYFDSGPVNGSAEAALTPQGMGTGDFVFDFGAMTEDIYYNAKAESLEAVGSVTLTPSAGTFNIDGTAAAPGVGSATLVVGDGDNVPFDMVFKYIGNFGGGPEFSSDLSIPVSGHGTFNGELFSGSWDLVIPITMQVKAASPTSFSFTEMNANGAMEGSTVVAGSDLVDATSDTTYEYVWAVSHEATTVPEPPILALFGTTLLPAALWRVIALRRSS